MVTGTAETPRNMVRKANGSITANGKVTPNGNGVVKRSAKTRSTVAAKNDRRTDYARWRLRADRGKQTWHYLDKEECEAWPQTVADKYHLGMDIVGSPRPHFRHSFG